MRSGNFVEETTTSIAGTGGNGAVTLTAIASTPRFSTVLGTQATTIRYVIEDTVGKRFETGIGSVAANVLTRTRPQITWDGSTYDDSTPAPIAFGSAPTAGDVRVRLSATAESQGANVPGFIQSTLTGSDATWGLYPLSAHITRWNNAGTARSYGGDVMRYQYVRFDQAGSLIGVQIENTTAAGGALYRHGLYSVGAAGLPTQLIATFNDQNLLTSGIKTDTDTAGWSTGGPIWITPGWYAYGFKTTGATNLRYFNNAEAAGFAQTPIGRTSSYAGYKGMVQGAASIATDPLPTVADLTGGFIDAAGQLWVGFRVQS